MKLLAGFFSSFTTRFSIVVGLLVFLKQNKMWWLIPMVLVLVVFFLLVIFAQSMPLGPFIYTLF